MESTNVCTYTKCSLSNHLLVRNAIKMTKLTPAVKNNFGVVSRREIGKKRVSVNVTEIKILCLSSSFCCCCVEAAKKEGDLINSVCESRSLLKPCFKNKKSQQMSGCKWALRDLF